jgi:AraC-like DNA-binding protein
MLVPPTSRVQLEATAPLPDAPPGVVALTMDREAVWRLTDRMAAPPDGTAPASAAGVAPVCLPHPAAVDRGLRALAALTTEAPPHRDVLVELNATQLVVGLLPTAAGALLRRGESAALTPGLADALRYVHRHLHRPLPVDELAEAACMSRSTFYRHFREALGVTPLQYVIRVRMERACALLRDPGRTVTDVALTLGFRSVSHFITTFKQHVGTTPRAYQERSVRARRLAGDA